MDIEEARRNLLKKVDATNGLSRNLLSTDEIHIANDLVKEGVLIMQIPENNRHNVLYFKRPKHVGSFEHGGN